MLRKRQIIKECSPGDLVRFAPELIDAKIELGLIIRLAKTQPLRSVSLWRTLALTGKWAGRFVNLYNDELERLQARRPRHVRIR